MHGLLWIDCEEKSKERETDRLESCMNRLRVGSRATALKEEEETCRTLSSSLFLASSKSFSRWISHTTSLLGRCSMACFSFNVCFRSSLQSSSAFIRLCRRLSIFGVAGGFEAPRNEWHNGKRKGGRHDAHSWISEGCLLCSLWLCRAQLENVAQRKVSPSIPPKRTVTWTWRS